MTAGEDLFARHRPVAGGATDDDAAPRDSHDQPVDHHEHVHEVVHVEQVLADGEASQPTDAASREAQAPDAGSTATESPTFAPGDAAPSDAASTASGPSATAPTAAAPADPDATTRIEPVAATPPGDRSVTPLAGPPSSSAVAATSLGSRRNGGSPRTHETWDTGTIRRWDAGLPDDQPAPSTAPLRRPAQLDDREEVTVERESGGSRWYEIPVMIITALTLAFLLRTFVVQVFYIPSGSMIPTLEVNDRIAVEKISYLTREPARGEVIVFAGDDPLQAAAEESTADRVLTGVGQFLGVVPVDAKDFVKRVIGLPGDEVSINDGQVSVNGVALDEPYARLDNDDGDWVVPEGMLFVMGDNRANSGDSRSTLGYIPEDDVVGRAVMVIWPFDHAGPIPGEAHDLAVDAGS